MLLGVITSYLDTKVSLGMTLDVRSDLFQHAQRLSMAYHDRHRSGLITYTINSTASSVPSVLMTGVSLGWLQARWII